LEALTDTVVCVTVHCLVVVPYFNERARLVFIGFSCILGLVRLHILVQCCTCRVYPTKFV